jgi:hypothetical protein
VLVLIGGAVCVWEFQNRLGCRKYFLELNAHSSADIH